MTRLALALLVAAGGVLASASHHYSHRPAAPGQSDALASVVPLRASRAQERKSLPGAAQTPHARQRQHTAIQQSRRHHWETVAECESSGDWHINTGNGYFGGLQFLLSTWRSFGGRGRPDQATEAEQIRVAERVLAVQGLRAWPNCGRYL